MFLSESVGNVGQFKQENEAHNLNIRQNWILN